MNVEKDAMVDSAAASIKVHRSRQPFVVDEDSVIHIGHSRCEAAIKLGMTEVYVSNGDSHSAGDECDQA